MTAQSPRSARFARSSAIALVLVVVTCVALATPGPASASGNIEFDLSCYVVGEHPTVTVTGAGFIPSSTLSLNLEKWVSGDKQVVQSFPLTVDAAGAFTLAFSNPGEERIVTVSEASEPDVPLVTKTLKATKFEAGYVNGTNRKGPTRVKSNMVLFGRGFAGGQQGTRGSGETASLYLHRVAPGGAVRTELLSRLQPCGVGGTNRVSGRALFKGSASVKAGKWKFQYDTEAKYKTATKQKIVLWLKVSKRGIVKPGEQTKVGKL